MLDKDVLGQALYDKRKVFDDLTYDEIVSEYGSIEAARLAACKADAEAIINHFKTAAQLSVPGTGLAAGSSPVTGISVTGTID